MSSLYARRDVFAVSVVRRLVNALGFRMVSSLWFWFWLPFKMGLKAWLHGADGHLFVCIILLSVKPGVGLDFPL